MLGHLSVRELPIPRNSSIPFEAHQLSSDGIVKSHQQTSSLHHTPSRLLFPFADETFELCAFGIDPSIWGESKRRKIGLGISHLGPGAHAP